MAVSKLLEIMKGLKASGTNLLKNRLFFYTTFAPTLLAVIYFGLIASDVYISESRFVVRSPEKRSSSLSLGALLGGASSLGASFSKAADDAYVVQEFVASRDASRQLDEQLKIKAAYASPKVDLFSRFAGLHWDDSFERFHLYYQKKVATELDPVSSILTLTVEAFDSKLAYEMNKGLLERSENLVNELNERGRLDMIRFASNEVAIAERKAKEAALTLARYRNQKGVIDPEKQSELPLMQISKIQDELIATRALLVQLESFAGKNPQIPALKKKIESLNSEMEAQEKSVTGTGNKSLASKAAEYQRLAIDREFADRQLATALSSLEQARNEAQRQQLYIERVAQPSLPDEALKPRRFFAVLTVFGFGLVAWGILTMLLAGVKEHMD